MLPRVLKLTPEYRDYVWGGQRLRPGQLTAEAWIVYEKDRVTSGPLAGKSLEELAAEYSADLLGSQVIEKRGKRFPVLIKLLDCNDWLSLQVHPNDEQARRLEGPNENGKTEAWYFLETSRDAQIVAGLRPGSSFEEFENATRTGSVAEMANLIKVNAGDTVFMPAGTVHALGPGLLVYEVQETSDLTYRVFDWNRPQVKGRILHIEKSLAVTNPFAHTLPYPLPVLHDGECQTLCNSDYFVLDMLNAYKQGFNLDTRGKSFHALTVTEGNAVFTSEGESLSLEKFDTILVPAATRAYHLEPGQEGFKILCASL